MARTEHEQTLAMECLHLAVASGAGDPVAVARRFHAFVTGAAPKTVREMIRGEIAAYGAAMDARARKSL